MMHSIWRKSLKNTCLFCLGLLLIAGSIECIALSLNSTYIFPHVSTMVKEFFQILGKKKTYVYMGNTILHLIEALLISIVLGFLLGILSGARPKLYIVLKPMMTIFRSLPIIVLILILMLTVGFDAAPLVATSLILIPLIYEGVYQGVVHLDKNLLDVYRLDSRLNLRIVFKVYLPLISSYSKTVFISAIGVGIKVLITAEYMSGLKNSLGKTIQTAFNSMAFELVYPYAILMILLTLILEAIPFLVIKIWTIFKEIRSNKKKIL